ncbi:MAG TPA: hypothetical protein VG960_05375 [Caulobacteraceae bacterium]|nr:hypothetical protein [Caulobacteraceae bacterium]
MKQQPHADPKSARAAWLDEWQLPLLWAAGLALAILLVVNKVNATPKYALVFNEMLVHLLHGRFDLDPSTIGSEAYVYKGRTYAYFGVFCALLRLPLLLTGQIGADITKLSMIFAAALSLGARLAAVRLAMSRAPGLSRELSWIILGAVAFGGESLQYLRPSLFQEVCSWGAALSSVFVLLAVRRILSPGPEAWRLYAGMALAAGLALLCRVSFGLGLYAAVGLMLVIEVWRGRARLPGLRALAPAVLVLALFAGLAGAVNKARWDDPLAFVPVRYQTLMGQADPDRAVRLARYGAVNPVRAPFALQYYFAPLWAVRDGTGQLFFQQAQLDLFDSVELPPSSFLLSDPLLCVLAALGLGALARRRPQLEEAALARGALLGLAIPGAVMLCAISLTFRYRMDFYPGLDFAACIGLAAMGREPKPITARPWLYMAVGGAVVSLISLTLYSYAPFGPAVDLDMRNGWITPMVETAQGRDPFIGHLMRDGRRLNIPAADPH